MTFEYAHLVDSLRNGSLIAVAGAGVSRPYTDPHTGRSWVGMPTAADLVATMAERRSYIAPDMPFPEASYLLKSREGRNVLEMFLMEHFDRPSLLPLPTHTLLANLGLSALVTSNYDLLLEGALEAAKKQALPVIDDSDVSRLRPNHLPLVKFHGSVSRPSTMVAAADEYQPLEVTSPVMAALLTSLLANKVALFVGYSLQDPDFTSIFNQLKRTLRDHMPRSYAVVRNPSAYQNDYWRQQGVTVVDEDATEFLRGLVRAVAISGRPRAAYYNPREDWINNAYFVSLNSIRTLPSETQVIDAFLQHLLNELRSPNLDFDEVMGNAAKAVELVLSQRPNYAALRRVSEDLIGEVRAHCATKESADTYVSNYIADRDDIARRIGRRGSTTVDRGDSMLLYSQSLRVVQLLKGVPSGVQSTCQLFIAECRPKSPRAFQDAIAFCEGLHGTEYDITIIPDAVIGSLLDRHQVHKIVMGAHAIFIAGGKPYAFVNTCGSHLVLSMAARCDTPVYIVAESNKLMDVPPADVSRHVSFDEEEELFEEVRAAWSELLAAGRSITGLNVGYDLCSITSNVVVVTDE